MNKKSLRVKNTCEVIHLISIRTDLVYETMEAAAEQGVIDGINSEDVKSGDIEVNRITVKTEQAAQRIGRKSGRYSTVFCPGILEADGDTLLQMIDAIAAEIRALLPDGADATLLIVGLGNTSVTPDALGPMAVSNVVVTRHIKENMLDLYKEFQLGEVAAISPGVLGQTGVESAEIIKGVVGKIQPTAVIAIDALMSRKMSRLAATVQLSDTGITPGSGLNNSRSEISEQTIGIPVIAVGMPTVIDAATLACDVVEQAENRRDVSDPRADRSEQDQSRYELIRQSLSPYEMNLVVTPKHVDSIIQKAARLLGYSINRAMHPSLTLEDMASFLS